MAQTDYGSDLSTYQAADGVPDLDPFFTVISGPRVVVERIARKLMTPTGSMLKAGWGYDLRQVVQTTMTAAELATVRGIVQDQIQSEPEVDSADVTMDYQIQVGTLYLTAIITLLGGETFPLVFTITADKVTFVVGDMTQEQQ